MVVVNFEGREYGKYDNNEEDIVASISFNMPLTISVLTSTIFAFKICKCQLP